MLFGQSVERHRGDFKLAEAQVCGARGARRNALSDRDERADEDEDEDEDQDEDEAVADEDDDDDDDGQLWLCW